MQTVWIMGLGPLLVHPQFVKDIGRRSIPWYINNIPVPKDVNDAIELIYQQVGTRYYLITKYMNQTMGNMMYHHVHRMHWKGIIRQIPNTYIIKANMQKIYAEIQLELFDDNFRITKRVKVISVFDMEKDQTTIKYIDSP